MNLGQFLSQTVYICIHLQKYYFDSCRYHSVFPSWISEWPFLKREGKTICFLLQHYFHPISSSKLGTNGSLLSSAPCNNPVVLQVTNLDQNIDAKDLKRMLLSVFREHVMVRW